ncbi:MAG TPA: DCC1-like thiol-disulfide oxidoreductase family protein [Vicinamibacterales bacterium]
MLSRAARTIAGAWMRFWFEPSTPTNLAVSRIVLYAPLTLFYARQDFSIWGSVSPALLQPIWLFSAFHLPVFSPMVLMAIEIVWKVSLATAAIGLFTNLSCLVSAILGLYLLGLPHNFGQTYHFDAAILFAFGVLAFSRCGDAWSIDALRRAARRPDRSHVVPRSGEYTWPIRIMWVTISLIFCAAGVAKLWTSGLEWVMSDHMAFLLQRVQYHISDADPVTNWGGYIAPVPWMARSVAAATLIVETLYPLALFRTPLRPVIVIAGIGLVVGIRLLMGPTFEHFLLVNGFWMPWDRIGARVRARLQSGVRVTVVYDGRCGLCRPTVAILRRLDLLGRVRTLDLWTQWDVVQRVAPSLTREAALRDMHALADGRLARGFDAYREIAWTLPLGWLLLPLLYLPPVSHLARRWYRRVADRRHGDSCALVTDPVHV